MGNIVHKTPLDSEPLDVVTAEAIGNEDVSREITEALIGSLMFPLTPSEDIAGKYIWINVNIRDPLFIKYQENGFKISTNDKNLTLGPVWLKKKRE